MIGDEAPETPELKFIGEVALMVKSFGAPKVKVAIAEWLAVPGDPAPEIVRE